MAHARLADDFYVTPAWTVHRLLDRLPVPWGGIWVEPSAGSGAIIKAVREYFVDGADILWSAIEKREEEQENLSKLGIVYCFADFLKEQSWQATQVSFVIGNPPYGLAFEFVQQALRLYPNAKIAYLLRLGFLASQARCAFMQENTPDIYVLPNRPSFAHGKTDSQEYAWFVWSPPPREAHGRLEVLDITPAEVRSKCVAFHPERSIMPRHTATVSKSDEKRQLILSGVYDQ